jgi:GNAT superfamily N-acetyltransferase
MEIRALRQNDDRSAFVSGDEALDRFLHRYAGQNRFRHHLGVTYLAVDGGQILGFATVAPRQVEIENLPEHVRKKLPRYPMPALGLARLAVDKSAQSMGIGRQLLRFVLELASKMADEVGCAAVVVDAKPGAVGFYAKYGFTPFEPLEGQSDARPQPTLMYLMMQDIKAATETLVANRKDRKTQPAPTQAVRSSGSPRFST